MQESYSEGLAIHADPESCGYVGNGISEALTGVRAGWVLSRESYTFKSGVPTLSEMSEGNTRMSCYGERHPDSARSETPRTYRSSLYRNWDIPCSALPHDGGKARTVNPMGVIQ